MLIHVPAEQYAAVLDAVAGEVLAAAKIDRPPVDAFAVARTLGITVAEDVHQSAAAATCNSGEAAGRGRRSFALRPRRAAPLGRPHETATWHRVFAFEYRAAETRADARAVNQTGGPAAGSTGWSTGRRSSIGN